jgi:hypothetical protein
VNYTLTAMRSPISTETKNTPTKAPKQARKSNLSIFQMSHAARRSISESTAEMMMAERIVLGVYLNKGVSTSNVMSTTIDIITLDIVVCTPAL